MKASSSLVNKTYKSSNVASTLTLCMAWKSLPRHQQPVRQYNSHPSQNPCIVILVRLSKSRFPWDRNHIGVSALGRSASMVVNLRVCRQCRIATSEVSSVCSVESTTCNCKLNALGHLVLANISTLVRQDCTTCRAVHWSSDHPKIWYWHVLTKSSGLLVFFYTFNCPTKTSQKIHPGRLTWNIIIGVWKMIFLSK